MRQIPKRLNNDGPGSMIIKDGGKPVAEMLAYTSSERDDTAAEFIERWNAFEPDGEVAQLRAENERIKDAIRAVMLEHDDKARAANFAACGCGYCAALRPALGKGAA